MNPENLQFTKEHEWFFKEEDVLTLGISEYAQKALGDLVFLELPEIHTEVNKGQSLGVLESIKSVSDYYAPIAGKIIEINQKLVDAPQEINHNPYEAWLVKIKISPSEKIESMNCHEYEKFCSEL